MKNILLMMSLILCGQFVFADLKWEMMPINPVCKEGISCTRAELNDKMKEVGIEKRLADLFAKTRELGGKVNVAFMSFSQSDLFDSLCAETKKGLRVDGFFDSKAGPPEGLAFRLERDCQATGGIAGNKNVQMFYMGQIDTVNNPPKVWRLHHNKFMIVELDPSLHQPMTLVHASANLSNAGLGINFENWNFVTGEADDLVMQDHLCDVHSMKAAVIGQANNIDDPKLFREKLEGCLSYVVPNNHQELNKLLNERGILTLFSPDSKGRNDNLLIQEINEVPAGSKIQAATYFFVHAGLAKALRQAAERGVHVQLIADDDLMNDDNSIPGQKKFYETQLAHEVSGIDVKIMNTNFDAKQLQHNKFLILYQKDRIRLFTGAGQFTNSAFHNNYENFYFVDQKDVVDQFVHLYETIWNRK